MQFQRNGFMTGIVSVGFAALLVTAPLRADDQAAVAQEPASDLALIVADNDAAESSQPALAFDGASDAAPLEMVDAPAELPAAAESRPIGVVRISDSNKQLVPVADEGEVVPSAPTCSCPACTARAAGVELSGNRIRDGWRLYKMKRTAHHRAKMIEEGHTSDCSCDRCRNPMNDRLHRCGDHLHRRYGYFCPSGGCGSGVQLLEHYGMVYPVNPGYFDPRDGQLFSAQGYDIPMAVPLAPNVSHTYNYGWGIPSSRITPLSRVVHHPYYIGPR